MPVITICPFCQKQNLSINIQKGFFKDKTILKCNYCKNIWEYRVIIIINLLLLIIIQNIQVILFLLYHGNIIEYMA